VAIGTIGSRTYAFVGLERGNAAMVFDITLPKAVTYTNFIANAGDVSPEGVLFIPASENASNKDMLVLSNEVSNTVSTYSLSTPVAYTLQILHYYGESGQLGVETAPIMGALIDKFDNEFANTLVLGEGDSWIPGPWLVAGADPSLNAILGSTALARPDVAIMNAFGTDASALGNHEFDLGSPVVSGAIAASGSWAGAQFPYITANLDFSKDSSLRGLADASIGGTTSNAFAGKEASSIKGKIAPYAVVTGGGEKIGIVGATTWDLLRARRRTALSPRTTPTLSPAIWRRLQLTCSRRSIS
jgi:hypothetical protein